MSIGTLYLVATPIGNLKDVTFRALETLKIADAVYAEDTRVTKKLFAHYGIRTPLRRYDEHAHIRASAEVKRELAAGRSIALVTDAGTPGIADPGARLVAAVRGALPGAAVVPIPGPSALTAALSAAGMPTDRFAFLGFPPGKKGRATFFNAMGALSVRPVVLYESPHRLAKTLAELRTRLGDAHELFIARELTKIHEECWSGNAADAAAHFSGARIRGEFVIVIR